MNPKPQLLVVAQNLKLANTLVSWLGDAGYELVLVTTFSSARMHLRAAPGVIITELKLGDYNGLHLALRARSMGIPAVVLGPQDPVLEHDAKDLGARYLSSMLQKKRLLETIEELLLTRLVDGRDERVPEPTRGHALTNSEFMWRLAGEPAPPALVPRRTSLPN